MKRKTIRINHNQRNIQQKGQDIQWNATEVHTQCVTISALVIQISQTGISWQPNLLSSTIPPPPPTSSPPAPPGSRSNNPLSLINETD